MNNRTKNLIFAFVVSSVLFLLPLVYGAPCDQEDQEIQWFERDLRVVAAQWCQAYAEYFTDFRLRSWPNGKRWGRSYYLVFRLRSQYKRQFNYDYIDYVAGFWKQELDNWRPRITCQIELEVAIADENFNPLVSRNL